MLKNTFHLDFSRDLRNLISKSFKTETIIRKKSHQISSNLCVQEVAISRTKIVDICSQIC